MKSVKTRFILSNIAMILIPVLISAAAGVVMLGHAVKQSGLQWHDNGTSFHRMGLVVGGLFAEYTNAVQENPDQFLDPDFQKKAEGRMAPYGIELAVLQNGQLAYSSLESDAGLNDALQKIATRNAMREQPLDFQGRTYGVIQNAVVFKDGSKGNIFLLSDLSPFSRIARAFMTNMAVIALLALLSTTGLLTWDFSRKVLKPLEELRQGTRSIMEGDLDFRVPEGRDDEVGELCAEFDLMRIKLKESLETQLKYEDNRRELISSISHDMRTPLAAIRGYVEGIADGIADTPEKQQHYLNTVISRIGDMERLIEALMFYSRLDMNQVELSPEPIIVQSFLENIVEDYRHMNLDGIAIAAEDSAEAGAVLGDRLQLRRVLINLLDNALNAVESSAGRVSIRAGRAGDRGWIEVQDTGKGIPPEHLPHIFDRFYRVDSARTTGRGGSGLGLAIVKRLVEGMQGTVSIESTAGKGTTVRIELPAVER